MQYTKILRKNIRIGAILLILVGIIALLVIEIFRQYGYDYPVIMNVITGLGTAMITVGIFDVFIGLTEWQNFFENILKSIFTEKNYLKTINDDELLVIQTEIYKKRTGREDIDKEGSFYRFFNEELFRYMSEPYREDVSSTITIIENEEGDLVATETIEYTCRAGKNGIQREIKYAHDTEIAEYHALIKIVISIIQPNGDEKVKPEILLEENFDKNDKKQEIHPVSLDKYVQNDKLRVRIETAAILNTNAFQTWTMAFPTRNFRLTIVVPEKLKVDCVALVDKKQQNFSLIHEQPHCISINLKSWMLPQNGFAFRISKRENKQIDDQS